MGQAALSISDLNVELDGEPRVRDIDLAERLAFFAPRQIRELIKRNARELETHGSLSYRTTNPGKQGGRPGKAYYLNEGQALVICALSQTPKAAEVRKMLTEVFAMWRKNKTAEVKQHSRHPPQPTSVAALSISDLNTTVNHEPRVQDVRLAQALGFKTERNIRQLIQRNQPELETYGNIAVRHSDVQIGNGATRKVAEYYLNEGQALVICALSQTPKAAEVRRMLIEVFMAWRRGQTVDVRQHYRRPPQPAQPASDITFELVANDLNLAAVRIIMPMRQVPDLMRHLHLVN